MKWLFSKKRKRPFTGSGDYWVQRYGDGRTFGSGSYGRLAEYKAGFINDFVRDNGIGAVIEFGSGDGNQASMFDFADYTGVDLVPQVVEAARARFADRPGWRFLTVAEDVAEAGRYDLAMSLDVIYHLVEDDVFEAYMTRLFAASDRFVLVYASDVDMVDTGNAHVRHRRYSDWVAANAPDFREAGAWDQPYPAAPSQETRATSFAAFKLFERRRLS
ncbi:class I SAM-dependent methyltransferase [Psychromarinibacter sp. S121]|uniref:class I SAM-dependent methyltransferase n=1 Tax=Psychromarinibacter sp. S121 TaxID=3415127 RepID=UPI003C79F6E3